LGPDSHHDWTRFRGARQWRELVRLLVQSKTLTENDLAALALLCRNHETRKQCEEILDRQGNTVEGAHGRTAAHPLLAARIAAAAEETGLLKPFGLTPATRLGIAAVKVPVTSSRQFLLAPIRGSDPPSVENCQSPTATPRVEQSKTAPARRQNT
jgi:P27 family predicted phage terminase small subunit